MQCILNVSRPVLWALPLLAFGCSQTPDATGSRMVVPSGVETSLRAEPDGSEQAARMSPVEPMDLPRTEEEWREQLTPEQFRVLRREGTEQAYKGAYLEHFEDGVYRCAGCGAQLYDSSVKFADGGWPNFQEALPGAVDTRDVGGGVDEVHCAKCDGHLGHIFNDGPGPTSKRH